MTHTIEINKSDCADEEVFEQLVTESGLSILDEDGNEKDVTTVTITGALTNDVYERQVQLVKEDLDETLWSEIRALFKFDYDMEAITIQTEEVELH